MLNLVDVGEIKADCHTVFRALAHNVFDDEDGYDTMREVLAAHLTSNETVYVKRLCKNVRQSFLELGNKIVFGEDCQSEQMVEAVIHLCADLFGVTFYCVNNGDEFKRVEIHEYAPESTPSTTTGPDPNISLSKRDFWLGINVSNCNGWKKLIKDDLGSYVPQDIKVTAIKKLLKKKKTTKEALLRCQSLVDGTCTSVLLKPENTQQESQKLKARLQKFGRRVMKIPGDGNCFFRSLSQCIFEDQERYPLMRTLIIELLKAYRDKFADLVPLKFKEGPDDGPGVMESYDDYLKRLDAPFAWGNDRLFKVVCEMFCVKLVKFFPRYMEVMGEVRPIGGSYKRTIFIARVTSHVDVVVSASADASASVT